MLKENKYQLTRKADKDLSKIAEYTIVNFGIEQARTYKDGLINTFVFLASNPQLGRDFILNNGTVTKRFRYKSHMIFFDKLANGILIIRVLGSRMNFKKHL